MVIDKQRKKLISWEVLILAALALLSAAVFVWLASEVVIKKRDLFDTLAFNYLHRWTSRENTTIALVVTRGGSDVFLIAIYLLVFLYFVSSKYKRQLIQLVIVVSASFLLNYLKSNIHISLMCHNRTAACIKIERYYLLPAFVFN